MAGTSVQNQLPTDGKGVSFKGHISKYYSASQEATNLVANGTACTLKSIHINKDVDGGTFLIETHNGSDWITLVSGITDHVGSWTYDMAYVNDSGTIRALSGLRVTLTSTTGIQMNIMYHV